MKPLVCVFAFALTAAAQQPPQPSIKPTPEETRQMQSKIDEIETAVRTLQSRGTDPDLVADVAVYAKAGRMLLEFPEDFFTRDGINHALAVLDTGVERARDLERGQSPWMNARPKRTYGFYSALDGSVQPYGIELPASYDPTRPARLYVWLHGRSARLTEADFLYNLPRQRAPRPPIADNGQIQLDVYGRWNGGGWHFAAEDDVFEAIRAVEKRYKIDTRRILLRGFSMGGEGAWHIAIEYPDRWAAAEIGAGTWPHRAGADSLPPYQQATLRIWENYIDWALNFFNLPLAAHDGENDAQLGSSIRIREQLAKEGFPSRGDRYESRAQGVPAIFLASRNTGHGTGPEVRRKLDAFLKEYGDRGQVPPGHIRFVTYTTRYNRDYWVSLDELQHQYERAEVDAQRLDSGRRYDVKTKNLTRLTLRDTISASEVQIDAQTLRVKPAPQIVLEKAARGWRVARTEKRSRLHKTHGLQGPIDDAFLDPFLLVRPTGTPWNPAVNDQALRSLARFDRLYAHYFRAHPRIKDDTDVTAADVAGYNVVLFGDPGSNRWIAKVIRKLPVRWTRATISLGGRQFPAAQNYPALVYPDPLAPSHYVVINSAMTFPDIEYHVGDYPLPRLGDFAVLTINSGAGMPGVAVAGLFDESWHLPKEIPQ